MLAGLLFDLGDTLVEHQSERGPAFAWDDLRPRMVADLATYLQTALGWQFDAPRFSQVFLHELAEYDRQRNTHFREYTTLWVLQRALSACEMPNIPTEHQTTALQAFFAYSETLWQLMPGAVEVLQALRAKHFKLGLVSNAMDRGNVDRILAHFALVDYFNPIIVSADVGVRKPNPQIFEPILTQWGLRPSQIAMVGDTLGADVLGGKHAGLFTIWLNTRANRPDNLAHQQHLSPDVTIRQLADIPPLLAGFASCAC
jgi:HAD superfamily hydrolase (TIGR01549 family)